MEYSEIIKMVFETVIIPLLGVLTTYLVMFLKNKTKMCKESTQNEMAQKYIDMLSDTITSCVIATNQTYVESLKKQQKFDAEAQKQAFTMTYKAIMEILSEDAKDYLTNAYGDLQVYVSQKIEAEVNSSKETA